MAGVIYQDAINVIPNDTINIPQPGPIVSGNNSSNIAAIIRDASKDFRRQVTNPQGYNVGGGSVVYNGGNIGEVIEIFGTTPDELQCDGAFIPTIGPYEVYNGNYTTANSKSDGFSLYVTGAGDLSVVTVFGNTVVIPVLENSLLDLQVIRENATGTTATGIIALQIQD